MYSIWQWNSNIRRQSSTIVRFQESSSKEPLLPSPCGGLIALACFLFPPNHSLDSRLDLAPHQTTLQILDSIWRQISDIGRWNSAIVRVRASLNENPLFPSPRGRGGFNRTLLKLDLKVFRCPCNRLRWRSTLMKSVSVWTSSKPIEFSQIAYVNRWWFAQKSAKFELKNWVQNRAKLYW